MTQGKLAEVNGLAPYYEIWGNAMPVILLHAILTPAQPAAVIPFLDTE